MLIIIVETNQPHCFLCAWITRTLIQKIKYVTHAITARIITIIPKNPTGDSEKDRINDRIAVIKKAQKVIKPILLASCNAFIF